MVTPGNVHSTIQQLSNDLHGYGNFIAINTIARDLNISIDELSPCLNTLCNMHYIKYAGRENEKVMLTFAGKHAPIPTLA